MAAINLKKDIDLGLEKKYDIPEASVEQIWNAPVMRITYQG